MGDAKEPNEHDLHMPMPPRKHDPLGLDYDVQDTITSLGSIVLNLAKKPPPRRKRYCPDGGHLLTILYTVIICILGVSFPVRDALRKVWLTTYQEAVFLAYLYGMSLIFILFVEIYLVQMTRKHGHQRKKDQDKPQIVVKDKNTDTQSVYDTVNGKFKSVNSAALQRRQSMIEAGAGVEIYILEASSEWDEPLPHHTSLYVRFGSIIFGVGNMIYDGLLLEKIQTNLSNNESCLDASFIWPHYVHLVFLLTQTYFIFKHPQVKITFAKPLARLGFMHIFATNVVVWFRTVVRETLESFLHHAAEDGKDPYKGTVLSGEYVAGHTDTNETADYSNVTSGYPCSLQTDILAKASPFLFPCVMEYSLLAAAVMFSMYADVGTHSKSSADQSDSSEKKHKEREAQQNSFITEINFHKSHKGMFAGVLVIAATCVSIVLFYSYLEKSISLSQVIYHSTIIGLYSVVLVATLIGIIQLQLLKFNRNLTTSVDDVMLVVAMGGLVLFQILKLLPLINSMTTTYTTSINALQVTESLLSVIVAIIHTWFLVDGMRRMASTEEQYYRKPGRGAVMFLLLTNIGVWLFRTFHMKEVEVEGHLQEDEYGYLAWQLIMHALLPLLIFYHFHCSACLAHIWSGAYVPPQVKPPTINHATSTAQQYVESEISPEGSPKTRHRRTPRPQYQPPPPPKHVASADLVPDRIIQFMRHGRAPPARNTSVKTIVEAIESPADVAAMHSVTWPRMHCEVPNGAPPSTTTTAITVAVTQDSIVDVDNTPVFTWEQPDVEMPAVDAATEKVVKWQLEPHYDDDDDDDHHSEPEEIV